MKKICLKIEGMHCVGCASRLEKILNVQDGIKKANVDFDSKLATIEYEDIALNKIEEYIESVGFKSNGLEEK